MQFSPVLRRTAELQAPFDRRALPTYCLALVLALSGLALAWRLGFTVSASVFSQFFNLPLTAIIAGVGLRRLGFARFGGAMEAMGLLYLQGLAALLLIVPLAAISAPLADHWLSAADHAVGFDWAAYVSIAQPTLPVLGFAYRSFMWQPALVAFLLFFTGKSARCWQLVLAATVAVTITALLFPFAPAEGAARFYGLPEIGKPFAPLLLALKGGERTLSTFGGLVSFPSYHTAAGVIFAWGCWPTRLRWPVAILNTAMIAAAIPLGSHYLIDILAGAIVAVVSILISAAVARGSRLPNASWSPSSLRLRPFRR